MPSGTFFLKTTTSKKHNTHPHMPLLSLCVGFTSHGMHCHQLSRASHLVHLSLQITAVELVSLECLKIDPASLKKILDFHPCFLSFSSFILDPFQLFFAPKKSQISQQHKLRFQKSLRNLDLGLVKLTKLTSIEEASTHNKIT